MPWFGTFPVTVLWHTPPSCLKDTEVPLVLFSYVSSYLQGGKLGKVTKSDSTPPPWMGCYLMAPTPNN